MNTDIANNIARKMLAKNILNEPTYSLQDLFRIRDACITLARFELEDKSLLNETLKYLEQKVGE